MYTIYNIYLQHQKISSCKLLTNKRFSLPRQTEAHKNDNE